MEDSVASRGRSTEQAEKPASHTPGPWRTSPHGDGRLIGTEHLRVAVVASSIEPHTPCAEAVKANARLIASAPDLCAALRHLPSFLEHVAKTYSLCGDDHYAALNYAEQARAAVSKATQGA